jgi:hypothetical protein
VPQYLSRPKVSKSLVSAYKAVSLAALSSRRTVNAKNAMLMAQAQYGRAVLAVNKAIQDPELVREDETLASVLLLAFYEVRYLHPFYPGSVAVVHAFINHLCFHLRGCRFSKWMTLG